MALVKLKNGWFGPDAKLYDKGVTEVPDHLVPSLPKSASLVESRPAKAPVAAETLKDHDPDRAAGDAFDAAADAAEKERLANAERIRAKLAAEKVKK